MYVPFTPSELERKSNAIYVYKKKKERKTMLEEWYEDKGSMGSGDGKEVDDRQKSKRGEGGDNRKIM